MKNFIQRIKAQAGFTMIELLVVIAVIGVLAVAVLSSINPIEQINKGRDTRLRSNAAQLINAADRFYAIQEIYPWNDFTYVSSLGTDTLPSILFPDGTACDAASSNIAGMCQVGGTGYTSPATGDNWLEALTSTDEVKQSFVDQLEKTGASDGLYLYKAVSGDLYVCFSPSSKQFQLEALDGCDDRAGSLPGSACLNGPYPVTVWTDELICLP